ncbi:MAG: molybdate ABC transporter permease subunit [Dehalococcoidales bacterium]|jgi:molybdate transport system permease protein|nr:molybdate ABC transporter permease subunit [Dehalococcoidales bacterium]
MTDYLEPLLVSLKTVTVTTAVTFFLGIAAARWMARYEGRFKSLIDGLFILPLVLPPTVVGYILLLVFGVNGPIGKTLLAFGEKIVFSWEATVIAATVMAFPIMYMTAKGAFEQVEPNIEAAARTLGAGEWRVFWTVTLPLAKAGVIAATVLAFARSLGEFGATLMLAGNIAGKTQTIPIAIYFAIQAGDMDKAMVLCIIVLAISFISLAAIAYWKGMAAKMKPVKVS